MSRQKLKLGVNIDHVATLREVRKTSYPGIVEAAWLCESAGAHAITVHLREDRRHINDVDVYALRKKLKVRMNLEMANSPEIVAIALKVRPDEVCIVPERRAELTTEGGLDVVGYFASLQRTVKKLSDAGIAVSLFIDPEVKQIKAAAATGAPWIEMHTGCFCNAKGLDSDRELKRLIHGAICAHGLGLRVNAGHGINLDNIDKILRIPYLAVLNIGHSIVCRAVFVGLKAAVREMLEGMNRYRGGVSCGRGHNEKR
ncbi:MAG: pyridoxine 5'-phosphate synthase [Lentisphaerae bacterium RIFOXYA12_FULL_48_11]|nr:MAG: pyridoxine 5'-phosphate synthase [Lentisphaerae bacterium RIFOXYA12_FULL_48_11]